MVAIDEHDLLKVMILLTEDIYDEIHLNHLITTPTDNTANDNANERYTTALIYAIQARHHCMVNYLLSTFPVITTTTITTANNDNNKNKKVIDINAHDSKYSTALIEAVKTDDITLVEKILSYHPNVHMLDQVSNNNIITTNDTNDTI